MKPAKSELLRPVAEGEMRTSLWALLLSTALLMGAAGCGASSAKSGGGPSDDLRGFPAGYKLPKPDPRPVKRASDLVFQMAEVSFVFAGGKWSAYQSMPEDVYFAGPGKDGAELIADMLRRHPGIEPKLEILGPKVRLTEKGTCQYEIRYRRYFGAAGVEHLRSIYSFSVDVVSQAARYVNTHFRRVPNGAVGSYSIDSASSPPGHSDLDLPSRLGLTSMVSGLARKGRSYSSFVYVSLEPPDEANKDIPVGKASCEVDFKMPRPKLADPPAPRNGKNPAVRVNR